MPSLDYLTPARSRSVASRKAKLYFFLPPAVGTLFIHTVIVVVIAMRVIMMRPATGVALAWLLLIATLPFAGAIIYLLIGERRIGFQRERGISAIRLDYRTIAETEPWEKLTDIDWSRHGPAAAGLDRLGRRVAGSPTVHGSRLQIVTDALEALGAIAREIDQAKTSVLIEFYIWSDGGAADEVLEAVIRAARRGVSCRLLLDALGSRPWWRGDQPQRLRDAGVLLQPALPVGLLRSVIGRTDLRLHRKIIVVDGAFAWTGSMNLVDPRFFKQGAGVGEWVDAMVRVEGAAVVILAAAMIGDWVLETGESGGDLVRTLCLGQMTPQGAADIQVIPSGPAESGDGLLQMLLALINAARCELILTTPYLVPDDSMLRALRGAAGRGVKVAIILPEKVDSFLIRHASRSYYDSLMDMGVEIHLYRDGLLHTKSIMVDGTMSMFGTVNLDMRSLWLNYEVALFVYDDAFAADLRRLQQSYIAESDRIDPVAWQARPFGRRFLENALRLMSPLL
jgi:cardiolipin synthase